jgi:flagellar hook-associated protein 2
MYGSSVTRITGMASGMDTDTLVKKLMDAEKMSLNKLKRQEQTELWRSDAYRKWNTDFLTFEKDTLLNMKLSGAYNTFEVSSSLESAVTGTGTASTFPGTYKVNVSQIAESASMTGTVSMTSTETIGTAASLTADTKISIKVNNDPNKTVDITIGKGDTITDIVSRFNSAKDLKNNSLGIQAYYDSTLKQFIIKTKETGANTKIDFSGNSSSDSIAILGKLGLTPSSDSGQNAELTFTNGTNTTPPLSFASNDVTIRGINLSLKGIGESTLSVSQDVDATVKNIKDFVDKYNDLLDRLNKANIEPAYRDYQPLLDEEREAMSEKQAELWEEKAKSGLLRNDSIISEMVNKMRSAMGAIVNNGSSYNSLSSIGIASKSYSDKGKLYVDEDKLRAALTADPDGVRNLFSEMGDAKKGTNGLVYRLSEVVSQGMKDLTTKAGATGNAQYDQSVIGKLLSNIQKNIDRQEDRLLVKENQYYKQFAAMEAAMSKYNSQSSWLYQQMGG